MFKKNSVLFLLLLSFNVYSNNVSQNDIITKPSPLTGAAGNSFGGLPLTVEIKMLVDVCKKESTTNAEYEKCMNSVKSYYESQKKQHNSIAK